MSDSTFEIRLCTNCGLRYPIEAGHTFGSRCPQCLGETRVVLRKSILEENKLREHVQARRNGELAVLLDNIRSAWNVGSILRSADGFGFRHAYLCGITPTPENEAVTKTSLGAEDYVTWSHHKDAVKLAAGLKREGWRILALEEEARALPIGRFTPQTGIPTMLALGSEVTGVDPKLLELCDGVYSIPMAGRKRSFNVAIAFGIAAYAMTLSK
ncbi:MAG: TrmH family RNA methyltransferase [Chloroflexi bacterium]|nr:TrmH family RNA methyltransferase [Chloroflexota bacterium]MDL1941555.1 RNA methyltransferase [Chloroflexi bacterium CFX2]